MFGNNDELEQEILNQKEVIEDLEDSVKSYKDKVKELNRDLEIAQEDNDIALRREEAKHSFELQNFKDKEVLALREEINMLKERRAVIEKENQMLGKIVDVNKDIIDVKNLVSTLIDKLPTININGMVSQPTPKAKK